MFLRLKACAYISPVLFHSSFSLLRLRCIYRSRRRRVLFKNFIHISLNRCNCYYFIFPRWVESKFDWYYSEENCKHWKFVYFVCNKIRIILYDYFSRRVESKFDWYYSEENCKHWKFVYLQRNKNIIFRDESSGNLIDIILKKTVNIENLSICNETRILFSKTSRVEIWLVLFLRKLQTLRKFPFRPLRNIILWSVKLCKNQGSVIKRWINWTGTPATLVATTSFNQLRITF